MAKQDTANHTQLHAVRVQGDLWRAALAKAAESGTTVSDVIRAALERYIR